MKIHLYVHSGEKPFTCGACRLCFAQSGHLKSHLRSDTDEKPFKCDFCGSCFAQNATLKTRLRTHSGKNPFVKLADYSMLRSVI